MAANYIITDNIRSSLALDFINKYKFDFGSTSNTDHRNQLYMVFGRSSLGWGTESTTTASGSGTAPAFYPNQQQLDDFWAQSAYAIQVSDQNLEIVVPKHDFYEVVNGPVGTTFNLFDTAADNPFNSTDPFYCTITSTQSQHTPSARTIFVYQLTQKTAGLSAKPDIVPNHTSGTVTYADGFSWTVLYSMTEQESSNIQLPGWIPVPYAPTSATNVVADERLVRLLGGHAISMNAIINDGISVADFSVWRQVMVVSNPLAAVGAPSTDGFATGVNGFVAGSEPIGRQPIIQRQSGIQIFAENRPVNYRRAGDNIRVSVLVRY